MLSTILGVTAATWAVFMALRRGSSEGVSVAYFCVLLVGFGLWVAYGLAGGDLPLVVPNTLAFVVTAGTIAVALRLRGPVAR